MTKDLTIKTTITKIEEGWDKNNNRFYKVEVQWDQQKHRTLYAFSTDLNLATKTLQTLTNSPKKLINQRVTITYRNFVAFAKIKEISE